MGDLFPDPPILISVNDGIHKEGLKDLWEVNRSVRIWCVPLPLESPPPAAAREGDNENTNMKQTNSENDRNPLPTSIPTPPSYSIPLMTLKSGVLYVSLLSFPMRIVAVSFSSILADFS